MNEDENRRGAARRETAETEVAVTIDVDGDGEASVATGVGFFDHMLESTAKHGLFDLTVEADGDLDVDEHHTVEDVGIVFGEAFADALGEKRGVERFADRRVPLDEAVASVVVDLSGRPLFRFDGAFSQERVGGVTSVMARHFWRSVAVNAGVTMHATVEGANAHHEVEALFKAAARALDDATRLDHRRGVPSTKGEL
jgi:imidazoleglycerol-phosphate dehydratase